MNYQKIYSFDMANGKGIRISLFVSGCNIHCSGCFNPEAQDFKSGKKFTHKEMKIIKEYLKNPMYDGLSILGGEPFDQSKKGIKKLIKLCKFAHKHNKNVWIWSGHTQEELISKWQLALLKHCDILIDGPFVQEQRSFTTPFRGSTNQRIIDISKNI